MYTRPATPGGSDDEWCHGGKCLDKGDLGIDFFFARDDAATYTEPLAFQLFPATENRDQGNWKKFESAGVQILNGDKDPSFFYAAYAAAKLGRARRAAFSANWELTSANWNCPRRGMPPENWPWEPHSERGRRVL